MRDCELTAKEIMCVAASLGATELYGIPDGFSGISKSSLNKELLKVQSSLEQKGYLKENFDGETSLSKEIVDVITVCSKCEKFIAIDKQIKNKPQEGILFYIKDSTTVKAVKTGDVYKMSLFDSSMIKTALNEIVAWKEPDDTEKVEFTVSNKVLTKAKTLKARNAEDAAIKELRDCGVGDIAAKVVLSGLNNDEDFYSFTFADLVAESNNIDNVMYIISNNKALRLKSAIEDEQDVVHFTVATYDGVLNELKAMLDKLSISGEVFK